MREQVCTTSPQADGQRLHKLWVSPPTLPQVVFATRGLGTTRAFVRNLSAFIAQAFTHAVYVNNNDSSGLIHTIHNPNNKYYKGE
jgi:hypothetical protein